MLLSTIDWFLSRNAPRFRQVQFPSHHTYYSHHFDSSHYSVSQYWLRFFNLFLTKTPSLSLLYLSIPLPNNHYLFEQRLFECLTYPLACLPKPQFLFCQFFTIEQLKLVIMSFFWIQFTKKFVPIWLLEFL